VQFREHAIRPREGRQIVGQPHSANKPIDS
jgi:hypothetical protein